MSYISIFCLNLTEAQKNLINLIEERTSAKVILAQGYFEPKSKEAFLAVPINDNWRGDLYESNMPRVFESEEWDELFYIRTYPQEMVMADDEITKYPDRIRHELEYLRSCNDSCNLLPSGAYENDTDLNLAYLLEFTELLNMGWYLGNGISFSDPFIATESQTEEDFPWEE